MYLFIDTTNQESVGLALSSGNKTVTHIFNVNYNLSEVLIPEIKKFLAKQKIKLPEIVKIGVVTGPGGFSKIRTAVATANALAFGLGIKVVGVRAGQVDFKKIWSLAGTLAVKPYYGHGPNITWPKK